MKNKQAIRFTFHQLDWLEKVAVAVSVWAVLFPKPYELVMGILLILPILGIIINGFQKPSIASLVKIPKEGKHDVADFIDFPAWAIVCRVVLDYEFDDFYSLILPGTIGFALLLVVLFFTHRLIASSTQNKTWIYTLLIFNIFLYSYGATYAINCTYDYSQPKVYTSKILDKRIHTGRRGQKTYYIEVAPWGHHFDKEEIRISRSQYEEKQIGENTEILFQQGVFNIPWYHVK